MNIILVRYEVTSKGEIFKLTVKNADLADSGEYTIQIGDRPNRCNVTVEPCELNQLSSVDL